MIRASELIGRAVVAREGGQEAGKIRDLVVDQAGKQVLGFVVSEGLLRSTKVAAWSDLQAIGPDSVVLNAKGSIVKAATLPEIKNVLDTGTNIRGLRVQTTEGKDLGRVEDFHFSQTTGAVEGYELSGGILSDTLEGRSYLPTPMSIELGKDVAFVAPEVEATITHLSGGIKAAFKKGE